MKGVNYPFLSKFPTEIPAGRGKLLLFQRVSAKEVWEEQLRFPPMRPKEINNTDVWRIQLEIRTIAVMITGSCSIT